MLLREAKSLSSIIETFDFFKRQTGLKVNYDKTNIYRIGSLRHSNAVLYTQKSFKWEKNAITVLGTTISCDKTQVLNDNYDKILKFSF